MPTTTATITQNGSAHNISIKTVVIPPGLQKPSILSPQPLPSSSMSPGSSATIRPLYSRATRAFLHRDVRLTYSLLEAAFAILQPPPTSAQDAFADDRRKWDILRITLESTVYTSNPSQAEKAALPDSLLAILSETPHTLSSKFYSRSLALFTPTDSVVSGPNAAYIPPQVLATLVLASLKLECSEFGRVMIEDWLARRDPTLGTVDGGTEHEEGYAKIMDLYCLHILPKLEQWDYAFEFLEYESELSVKTRERLKSSLKALHTQSMTSRSSSRSSSIPNGFDTPRPHSPAPSSSSSSSLSTTSTHTVVPSNRVNGMSRSLSRSSSSSSSKSDATARAKVQPQNSRLPSLQTQNGHARSSHSRSRNSRTASLSSSSGTRSSTLPRAPTIAQSTAVTRLSTYSLVKAAIQPYLTTSRRRRKARLGAAGGSMMTNAELVRRRLGGVEAGLLGRVWGEVSRAVIDTVKMAGSGLFGLVLIDLGINCIGDIFAELLAPS
ncbi:hypothetical protein NP233_g7779 [Leucocoprinus birnbaumii]|uniref:Uncharacterized protein n=1 Tax=Leucocoprinus birnbaumii TaxID=56174 RepID=A0AAD5VNJ1_9AGAR|nr:hypothetical protein NP233_g7779 [Leucocoprinus birnbaumii]